MVRIFGSSALFIKVFNIVCWLFGDTDAETLVIATHGFVKKTQKTPSKEINKAEAIRKLYFNSKK